MCTLIEMSADVEEIWHHAVPFVLIVFVLLVLQSMINASYQ